MASNELDKVLYAWRLFQRRVNDDWPSWARKILAAKRRLDDSNQRGVKPPPEGL